jgi:hypothetical protein
MKPVGTTNKMFTQALPIAAIAGRMAGTAAVAAVRATAMVAAPILASPTIMGTLMMAFLLYRFSNHCFEFFNSFKSLNNIGSKAAEVAAKVNEMVTATAATVAVESGKTLEAVSQVEERVPENVVGQMHDLPSGLEVNADDENLSEISEAATGEAGDAIAQAATVLAQTVVSLPSDAILAATNATVATTAVARKVFIGPRASLHDVSDAMLRHHSWLAVQSTGSELSEFAEVFSS